jgi:hypothetical protein
MNPEKAVTVLLNIGKMKRKGGITSRRKRCIWSAMLLIFVIVSAGWSKGAQSQER